MDYQKEDHTNAKRPHSKELPNYQLTHNMPIEDEENIDSTV